MRDIHVGKRGSEAAGEEQPDKLRNTVRFEQRLRVQQRLPIQLLLWNILRVVRHKIGRGPFLCRSQVMLVTTYKFRGGTIPRDGWTKESLHLRSVGLVSVRRCRRSQEKRIK